MDRVGHLSHPCRAGAVRSVSRIESRFAVYANPEATVYVATASPGRPVVAIMEGGQEASQLRRNALTNHHTDKTSSIITGGRMKVLEPV